MTMDQSVDVQTDAEARRMSRRMVLRRSMLGVTGVGLAALLAACGDGGDEGVPAGDAPGGGGGVGDPGGVDDTGGETEGTGG